MKKMVKVILAAAAVVALAVPAMGAENKLIVKGTDGTSNVFVATDGGSVGIGGNPVNVLDVYKEWPGVLGTNLVTAISVYKDQARYTFRRANGTAALPTALANGDAIGNINFRGYNGADWTPAAVAAISINTEEAFTSTANGARISFFTQTKGTTANGGTERFRISSLGNVIIANGGGAAAAAALPVTATDGHMYIPTTAGAVTSCATMTVVNAGHAPLWIDPTNSKVCSCVGGALKCATLL